MDVQTTYVRHFSEIGKIQKEKNIRYELVAENESDYGIRVTLEGSGCVQSDYLDKLTASRQEALDLLAFLYENSISLDGWRDLATDMMKSIHNLC